MKRILLIGLLFAAKPFSPMCHGEGYIVFNTYVGTVYQPITYGAPLPAGTTNGQTVGTGFQAQLYYGLGSGLPFSQLSPVPGSVTPVGTAQQGYVAGAAVVIPGYTDTNTPVTFAVVAYNGTTWVDTLNLSRSDPTLAATPPSLAATWTEPTISTDPGAPDYFSTNLPAIVVTASIQDTNPPSPPRLTVLSGNSQSFTFQLTGQAYLRYVIQISTNLANWSSISTNVLPTTTVVFTNTAAGSSRRFWRAVWVP